MGLAMIISAQKINETQAQYQQEKLLHQTLLVYKPVSRTNDDQMLAAAEPETSEEPSAVALLRAQYPSVVGWITIPGTKIDYPFVQADDNDKYLSADLNGDYLAAGSVFLDYRSAPDFNLFNTVMYGHNMKNGSMFGSLPTLSDAATFAQVVDGAVHLEGTEYRLEIFVCMVTNSYDGLVYNSLQNTDEEKQEFLDYVQSNAVRYRDIGPKVTDRFLTLSTCSYEFADARTVVIGRLIEQ